jgi:cytochrome b561
MNKKIAGSYSRESKVLHWLIAVIVIMMLSLSFFLDDLPDQYRSTAFMLHKSLGLTVLFLMYVRILTIWLSGKPPLPDSVPLIEKMASRSLHYSFYILLIAMPLSGWIMSVAANRVPTFFGLFRLPLPIEPNKVLASFMKEAHEIMAWILVGMVILHVLAALKHHFINKNNVLKRMLP